MKITEITVKQLYTYGEYRNVTFGYTASIDDGEDPAKAKEELFKRIEQDWTDFIGNEARLRYHEEAEREAMHEESRKRREIDGLQRKIDTMIEFLKEHGVDTTSYELPF